MENSKDNKLILIIIILIIMVIVFMIFYGNYMSLKKDIPSVSEKEIKEVKKEELSLPNTLSEFSEDSDYQNYIDLLNDSMYQAKEVLLNNIDITSSINNTLDKEVLTKSIAKSILDCDELDYYNGLLSKSNMTNKLSCYNDEVKDKNNNTIYKLYINHDLIKGFLKKHYGPDVDFKDSNFMKYNFICNYDNKVYNCITLNLTKDKDVSNGIANGKIIDIEETKEELVIYEIKYFKKDNLYYSDFLLKNEIDLDFKDSLSNEKNYSKNRQLLPIYKHTFKENSNNNDYYWYKTTIINNISS